MLAVIAAGLWLAAVGRTARRAAPAEVGEAPQPFALGSALVFVFLAYGGWSDTATLAAEMRDTRNGIKRALRPRHESRHAALRARELGVPARPVASGLARSEAPAADLLLYAFGTPGQALIVSIVALTSITSMNAIMIAGARTTYAAARDTAGLARLGGWHVARGTPPAATVATAGLALALVAFGAYTRGGFATMVDYLSPVYWLFLTLSGIAMLVLRRRYPHAPRPFRVPGYPWVPLAFIASSAYVLYSSLAYVRIGAVAGIVVLAAGCRAARGFAARC